MIRRGWAVVLLVGSFVMIVLSPFVASAQDSGPAPVDGHEGLPAPAAGRDDGDAPDTSSDSSAPGDEREQRPAPEPKEQTPNRFAAFGSAATNGSEGGTETPSATASERAPSITARDPEESLPAPGEDAAEAQRIAACRGPDIPESATHCDTPRNGSPSGAYLAFDFGFATPTPSVTHRVGLTTGFAGDFRVGFEFLDHIVVGMGGRMFSFSDERQITESVYTCYNVNGVDVGCDSTPHDATSSSLAWAGFVDLGYQHRFRPSSDISLTGGVLAVFEISTNVSRRIGNCSDCDNTDVNAKAGGIAAAPFFRITFGRQGAFALIARSEWFLVGDLLQTTLFGIELGAP